MQQIVAITQILDEVGEPLRVGRDRPLHGADMIARDAPQHLDDIAPA